MLYESIWTWLAWCFGRSALVCLSCTRNGSTLRVSQHQDQATTELPSAKFQGSQHASLGMCAGVPRIPKNKQLARHSIKDGVYRHSRIGTTQDGTVRSLVVFHQSLSHVARCLAGRHCTNGESLIAILLGGG